MLLSVVEDWTVLNGIPAGTEGYFRRYRWLQLKLIMTLSGSVKFPRFILNLQGIYENHQRP